MFSHSTDTASSFSVHSSKSVCFEGSSHNQPPNSPSFLALTPKFFFAAHMVSRDKPMAFAFFKTSSDAVGPSLKSSSSTE
jgi:hypothetical protein